MSLFAQSKRYKPDRVTCIVKPRPDLNKKHFDRIRHIVRSVAVERAKEDGYTATFGAPIRAEMLTFSLTSLPPWKQAECFVNNIIDAQKDVLVFGDYDCDGITATTLMLDYLECAGLDPDRTHWFIPNRFHDAYGLSFEALEKALAMVGRRPKLMIIVDCGSPSLKVLEYIRELGITTMVLDHHPVKMLDEKHPAAFHLNPKGWSALANRKDLHELCASGLVYYFCDEMASRRKLTEWNPWRAEVLAGVATYADVMPVFRLNRQLIKRAITHCQLEGIPVAGYLELHHLIHEHSREKFGKYPTVNEKTFGFEWGPCINATGRLKDARNSLRMLREKDPEKAKDLAQECYRVNQRRIGTTRRVLLRARQQALAQVHNNPPVKVILAAGKKWNIGVVGIVAARLREEFCRPAIVCGMHDGIWRGSGRSVEGFDLGDALKLGIGNHVLTGGGHAMAGGVSFREDQRPEFHNWINHHCNLSEDSFIHTCEIVAHAEEFSPKYWSQLINGLRPFGQGHQYTPILLEKASLERFRFHKYRNQREREEILEAAQEAGNKPPDDENRPDLFATGFFQPKDPKILAIEVTWRDSERARREWRRGHLYTLELSFHIAISKKIFFTVIDCWPEGKSGLQKPPPSPESKSRPIEVLEKLGMFPKGAFTIPGLH